MNLRMQQEQGLLFFFCGATALLGPRSTYCRNLGIILRHATLGTTPRDEWSAHRWDLYLTTRKIHNKQTSMSHGVIRILNPSKRVANGIGAVHYINDWSTNNSRNKLQTNI